MTPLNRNHLTRLCRKLEGLNDEALAHVESQTDLLLTMAGNVTSSNEDPAMNPFIVAEVSKTWIDGREIEPGELCEYFEVVVNVYYQRGYRLLTFSLNRVMTRPDELNATIIAVFEAVQPDENR